MVTGEIVGIEHDPARSAPLADIQFEDGDRRLVLAPEATKGEIAEAVEQQFDVGVASVNTQMRMDGDKKATVTLVEGDDAQEVASRIGVF